MTYVVVAYFFILYFLCLYIDRFDFMSPQCLFVLGYFLASISTLYYMSDWHVYLGSLTVFILVVGSGVFCATSIMLEQFTKNKKRCNRKFQLLKYSRWKIILLILLELIAIVYCYYQVQAVAESYGIVTDISSMMKLYRENVSYGDVTNDISGLAAKIQLFADVVSYLFSYSYIYNSILSKKEKICFKTIDKILYFLCIIMCIPFTLISGGRGGLIYFAIATCFFYVIINKSFYGWNKRKSIHIMAKICIFLVMSIVFFYVSKGWIGRPGEEGVIDYIALYFGGSIECLDQYLQYGLRSYNYFDFPGIETFKEGVNMLARHELISIQPFVMHKEFVYIDGRAIGNAYTEYFYWYKDFGILGILVLQTFMSAFITYFYRKSTVCKNSISLCTVVTAFVLPEAFFHAFGLTFYGALFSSKIISEIVFFYVAYYCLRKREKINE